MTHQDATSHSNNAAFNELLSTWLKHEDLRAQRAPIASLAASRAELDGARLQAFRGLADAPAV